MNLCVLFVTLFLLSDSHNEMVFPNSLVPDVRAFSAVLGLLGSVLSG